MHSDDETKCGMLRNDGALAVTPAKRDKRKGA